MEDTPKLEDDFDFEALHPPPENPLSNFATFITLAKAALGTGLLALPNAMSNAGIVTGTVLGTSIALLNGYIVTFMIKLKHKVCVRENIQCTTLSNAMGLGYKYGPPCIAKMPSFGSWGVTITLGTYQVGILCVYYVFIVENISQVCMYNLKPVAPYVYYLSAFPFFCLLMLVRNIKYLAICANFAVIGTIGCIAIIFYYVFRDPLDLPGTELARPISSLLLFLGTAMFSTNNLGVALSLEAKMKTPKSFRKVYGCAVAFIIILCMAFGNICYMKYTKNTKGAITLNLPEDEGWAQAVKIIYSFIVFISYGIQVVPTVELIKICWPPIPKEREFVVDYLIRTGLCVFACTIGLLVPNVGKLISFIGCLCLPLLYYLYPTLLDISLHWQDAFRQKELHCIKDTLLILFGIFATIVGTTVAALKIINK